MRIFVGLSGGVDSAVAAARLIEARHEVVGVFIKVWHPDWLVCNWEAERLDAMRVAAYLQIPFLTCNAEAAYRDEVAKYFISEYEAGRTPNPDVMCNQHVKFGAFLDFAREHGAKAIATGHYARREDQGGEVALLRGVDPSKDQSYFLWSLSKAQLSQALFPVGDTTKTELRKEAARRGLPVAERRDSQGICFLGHVDIKDFLSHYITLTPGDVLNEEGSVIGVHDGAVIYTLGQRHGFVLSNATTASTPHYVVGKDVGKNTATVSPRPPITPPTGKLHLIRTVLRTALTSGETLEVQTRYRQQPTKADVLTVGETDITIAPHTALDGTAPGQSCVLYRGEHCLGGGIMA